MSVECNSCYHLHVVENAPISSATIRLGLCLNLENFALSQWSGYNFNSACKFKGICLGANEDGLFRLNTGSLDLGVEIDAYFKLILSDFGVSNNKRLRKAYITGEGSGELVLTVENDEGNSRDYSFELSTVQKATKVAIGRDGKGAFWSVKVANTEGNDFGIDSIALALETLNK